MTRSTPQRRVRAASDPKVILAQLLRQQREALALRQQDLRDHRGTGTGPGLETVQRWERGKAGDRIQPETLRKFNTALGLADGAIRDVLRGAATTLALTKDTGRTLTAQVTGGVDIHRPDFAKVTRRQHEELIMRSTRLVELVEHDLAEHGGSDEALMNARAVRDLISDLTARTYALYHCGALIPGTTGDQMPLANGPGSYTA